MKVFTTQEYGRTFVIHLRKGEKVLESLKQVVEEYGIKNGVLVSAIGSLNHGSYHAISNCEDRGTDVFYQFDGPIELATAQGMIIDGVPHFHMNITNYEDKAYGGHMETDNVVQYLAEFCIIELLGLDDLTRKKDEFGVAYIDKKD